MGVKKTGRTRPCAFCGQAEAYEVARQIEIQPLGRRTFYSQRYWKCPQKHDGLIDDEQGAANEAAELAAKASAVRSIDGGALTLALGIAPKGIKFDPAGKANTRVVFFMVIPTAASAFYLKLLSGLAQVFQKEENRDKLLEADTPEKLWKALMKATRLVIQ